MQYLIKEFGANEHCGYAIHLVTDDGTELTVGSLWNWIWLAKRDNTEISVYRLLDDLTKADLSDQILAIGPDDKPVLEYVRNFRSIAELDADPSLRCYRLECVLDLS